METEKAQIVDRVGQRVVEALLHVGLSPEQLLDAEAQWQPHRLEVKRRLIKENVPRRDWPQSLHWDWSNKADAVRYIGCTGYGLQLTDAEDVRWQGLMMTVAVGHQARAQPDAGKELVYVDFLETAPWNSPLMVDEPAYKAIGSLLLRRAILQSLDEEFHGRVGLHALPQAEPFYRHCGMTGFGPDPQKQGLAYFEFTREQARAYLEKGATQ